jgi:hypothetical protein
MAVDVVRVVADSDVSRTRRISGSTIAKNRLCGSRQTASRS